MEALHPMKQQQPYQTILYCSRLALFVIFLLFLFGPLNASAQTFTFANGPLDPPGAIDGSTATTTFLPVNQYSNGAQDPPGAIDGGTATTTFSVQADDFPAGYMVGNVKLQITFAKVGGGTCPGPGGGDDWAEEIRFRLTSPSGVTVTLVRYGDYNWSNPDVGQVTVTFDDDALRSVAGLKIKSGTFKPSNGAMADFTGSNPEGQWTLSLSDRDQCDPLCFDSAILTITTARTVRGTVTCDGATLAGVAMTGLPGEPVTDADGSYAAFVVYGWSGTAVPTFAGRTFSPVERIYADVITDFNDQNYVATINTYTISGTVTDGTNPLSGATLTFSHNGHTETTAADGTYSYVVPYGTTTTVTPSHSGYHGWSPVNRTVNAIAADAFNHDFQGTINTYTISGTVTDGTNPVEGVTITFSHDNHTETTAADGSYSYVVPYGTTTMVTPSHGSVKEWTPAHRDIPAVETDVSNQDFQCCDDGDGTDQENGPDGTDPSYDGNGDGMGDGFQDNVSSFASCDGQSYLTISCPDVSWFENVQAIGNPSPDDMPTVNFPCQFFEFEVLGLDNGGTTTVTVYLPEGTSCDTYWKYGPTPDDPQPHWYEFLYDGTTGAEIIGDVIILHFVDGKRGDDDLSENGIIVDQGGPGKRIMSIPALCPRGMSILILLVMMAAAFVLRKKRTIANQHIAD